MFIARSRLEPLAPSGTTSVDGLMPPLTELVGIIHRIAINIALLTERESVQYQQPVHSRRFNVKVKDAVDSLIACLMALTLGLRGKKGSVFTDT